MIELGCWKFESLRAWVSLKKVVLHCHVEGGAYQEKKLCLEYQRERKVRKICSKHLSKHFATRIQNLQLRKEGGWKEEEEEDHHTQNNTLRFSLGGNKQNPHDNNPSSSTIMEKEKKLSRLSWPWRKKSSNKAATTTITTTLTSTGRVGGPSPNLASLFQDNKQ